jgi:hypothetical protein
MGGEWRVGWGDTLERLGMKECPGKPASSEQVLDEQKKSIHRGVRWQSKWVT